MYVGSSFVYMVFYLPIALGQNITTVIIARFIGGIAASTGSTLVSSSRVQTMRAHVLTSHLAQVGGTIADIFEAKDRGLPMSLFSLCAFSGTGLGPGVMGYVEQYLGWRWINWIQMIMAGVMFIAIVVLTRETRGSVLLSKRAAKMRKETGDDRYQCRSDAERASLAILIRVSLTRPICKLDVADSTP
jgi:MFS family permease